VLELTSHHGLLYLSFSDRYNSRHSMYASTNCVEGVSDASTWQDKD